MQEPHRQALAELAAAGEREYLDDGADQAAAERYYAGVEPDADPVALYTALSHLLESTHRSRPEYRPSVELYPWIDLQPDGKLRSVFTREYFLLRYPRSLDNRDPQGEYTEESVPMLLKWHAAEPVSEYERHRNAAIFVRQGNRNPLIDHPDSASRIAFAEGI